MGCCPWGPKESETIEHTELKRPQWWWWCVVRILCFEHGGTGCREWAKNQGYLDSSNWKDGVSTNGDELDYESIMTRGEGGEFSLARFEVPVRTWRENSEKQWVYGGGGSVNGGSERMERKWRETGKTLKEQLVSCEERLERSTWRWLGACLRRVASCDEWCGAEWRWRWQHCPHRYPDRFSGGGAVRLAALSGGDVRTGRRRGYWQWAWISFHGICCEDSREMGWYLEGL